MIVEYIRYRLEESAAETFIDAYGRASASLDVSPFCSDYELARCEEEQGVFILRIEWTSAEDHLQGFRKSAEFRAFLGEIRPYIEQIEEMRHYEVTRVASA